MENLVPTKKRRKRFVLSDTLDDIADDGDEDGDNGRTIKRVYDADPAEFWQILMLNHKPHRRPLPSSQVLSGLHTTASVSASISSPQSASASGSRVSGSRGPQNVSSTSRPSGKLPPVLANFYAGIDAWNKAHGAPRQDAQTLNDGSVAAAAIRKTGHENSNDETSDGRKSHHGRPAVKGPMDESSRSTLSIGQHRRYLQLLRRKNGHTALPESTSSRFSSLRQQRQHAPGSHMEMKEWKKLKSLVAAEQSLYFGAVGSYLQHYKYRYWVGFSKAGMAQVPSDIPFPTSVHASGYVALGMQQRQQIMDRWISKVKESKFPQTWGPCNQMLTVSPQSSVLDTDQLSFRLLPHMESKTPRPCCVKDVAASLQSLVDGGEAIVPPPMATMTKAPTLLMDDEVARDLALQNSAKLIASIEALECLLQVADCNAMTSWMLSLRSLPPRNSKPMTKSQKILQSHLRVLDIPIHQPFPTPRECLEDGCREAIYQSLCKHEDAAAAAADDDDGDDSPAPPNTTAAVERPCQYRYSLWALPRNTLSTANRRGGQHEMKILVRFPVRLVQGDTNRDVVKTDENDNDDDDGDSADDTTTPVILRCHVDYFPEQSKEILNTDEKVLWMLDQLLTEHKGITKLCRINPFAGIVTAVEDTSIAHALADDDETLALPQNANRGPQGVKTNPLMIAWHGAIQILAAIPTVPQGEHLLQYPSKQGTQTNGKLISIHGRAPTAATATAAATAKNIVIDLGETLSSSNLCAFDAENPASSTSSMAIQLASRYWLWSKDEQVPYTFPPNTQQQQQQQPRSQLHS